MGDLIQLLGVTWAPAFVVGALASWALTKAIPQKAIIVLIMVLGGVVFATSSVGSAVLIAEPEVAGDELPTALTLSGACLGAAMMAFRAYRELPPE